MDARRGRVGGRRKSARHSVWIAAARHGLVRRSAVDELHAIEHRFGDEVVARCLSLRAPRGWPQRRDPAAIQKPQMRLDVRRRRKDGRLAKKPGPKPRKNRRDVPDRKSVV